MEVAEFRRLGLLQEVNRRFLHPCGLALEVTIEPDGTEKFGRLWDYRDDPEGMLFGPGEIDPAKIAAADALIAQHADERIRLEGAVIQPPDGDHAA